MPAAVPLPIRDLVLIPELSPRERLNEEAVIRYMESFGSLPPVRVQAGTMVLIDGYHRVEAAIRLGLEVVPATEEPVPDPDLRLDAGLANARHGIPLSRSERNRLAVALVRQYAKVRDEVASLMGMSTSAVTLALREAQFNEMLSERLGTPVQVINSVHVRALYRVGPEQRERLLEAVVTKVDDSGRPAPLSGAELKLLVDRMLDPATPQAELNRLLSDPRARPRPPLPAEPRNRPADAGPAPIPADGYESPFLDSDPEDRDRVLAVDELIGRTEVRSPGGAPGRDGGMGRGGGLPEPDDDPQQPPVSLSERENATAYAEWSGDQARLREGVQAAVFALRDLVPQIQPPGVRDQVAAVLELLQGLG